MLLLYHDLTLSLSVKYEKISFEKAIVDNLRVMDATALSLCRENNMPIIVFNALEKGNMMRMVNGEKIGTVVTNEK